MGTKYEIITKFIVCSISVFCVACSKILIKYLYLISNKYSADYLNVHLNNSLNLNLTWEVIKVLFLIVMLVFLRYNVDKASNKYEKKYFDFCKFLLILDFIFFQLGTIFTFSERFSYYFMIISYSYLLPCLIDSFKLQNRKEKFFGILLVYACLCLYFYIVFNVLAVSSIIPYTLC